MSMPRHGFTGRVSRWFLWLVPFLAAGLVGVRSLRASGAAPAIGGVVFLGICVAVGALVVRAIRGRSEEGRLLAIAGVLLLVPFALIALLWVGLGTPWDSSPAENQMRYLVLLGASVGVTGGFVVLKEALCGFGERLFSTLGFGAGLLAGAGYLVWLSVQVGAWTTRVRTGEIPQAVVSLNDSLDTLLFAACALTYLATASFAASFGKARWIGRGASLAFLVVSLGAFVVLAIRGLSFPDPSAGAAAWHTRPGFIAGIPAVPWIVPHLLGVGALWRAGSRGP